MWLLSCQAYLTSSIRFSFYAPDIQRICWSGRYWGVRSLWSGQNLHLSWISRRYSLHLLALVSPIEHLDIETADVTILKCKFVYVWHRIILTSNLSKPDRSVHKVLAPPLPEMPTTPERYDHSFFHHHTRLCLAQLTVSPPLSQMIPLHFIMQLLALGSLRKTLLGSTNWQSGAQAHLAKNTILWE